ncbi:NAD-dependent deacetylase [Lentilactobacillus senioris DSM 24302 = JCM 17472]|uniref:protein acetyllysine N-acetyltransferase n=1 Tax=Lentilactobacillus senioris DSM 24302 = JCM 17472 TaxID=1423802 RepID=A0A0R2D3B8_9LACO|nr:NAD-dependent protein deacylase [Lentilactobacillus senioris]KRM94774.1 NAD-dependent deacetylase [Lentilactobacillus senioris DSM 24302 = JCM 17472]
MEITELQQLIDQAQKIVFLTGAGVSTASGIPDYRSKNGLYTNSQQDKPAEYYLSHECLVNEPEVFYEYLKTNLYYPDAKPNVIHERQAELTRQGKATVITQNIDGLYCQAQTENLLEFHGNLTEVYCQKCGQSVSFDQYLNSRFHETCGGELRPNVVLYGEGLDEQVVADSVAAMQAADLVVIVGTSMRVYPFAGLLDFQRSAPVVAINAEPLNLGSNVQMMVSDAVEVFNELRV